MVESIVVRNNTLVGKLNAKNDGRYCLNTAVTGGAPALSAYNNIFVGIASISGDVGNNIIWSYNNGGFQCSAGSNHILTCKYADRPLDYFETGFFVQKPNFNAGHGQIIDYRLAAGSPAINFGDPSRQPSTSLGTLGADGFIRNNGVPRDTNHHSAGAYEYAASSWRGDGSRLRVVQQPAQSSGPAALYDILGRKQPKQTR